MWDKEILTPRLTACFGEMGTDYTTSGKIADPMLWTKELLEIKARIEPFAGVKFNSVLLNITGMGTTPLHGIVIKRVFWEVVR